jgi:hypothetical protein
MIDVSRERSPAIILSETGRRYLRRAPLDIGDSENPAAWDAWRSGGRAEQRGRPELNMDFGTRADS